MAARMIGVVGVAAVAVAMVVVTTGVEEGEGAGKADGDPVGEVDTDAHSCKNPVYHLGQGYVCDRDIL